jgi:hypothetical protein
MVPSQLDVGANYPITIEITDAMVKQVKEWFAVDTFTALRQMDGLQNATATAVAAMQGEQTALLTPMVTNLYLGLAPAIERTFNILAKKKLLQPLPFALQQMGGSLKLDFLGVLAQAQKAAYVMPRQRLDLQVPGCTGKSCCPMASLDIEGFPRYDPRRMILTIWGPEIGYIPDKGDRFILSGSGGSVRRRLSGLFFKILDKGESAALCLRQISGVPIHG